MFSRLFGGGAAPAADGSNSNNESKPVQPAASSSTSPEDTVKNVASAITEEKEKNESFNNGFNPLGLERAAKAARELDNSKNAEAAVKLAMELEQTKRKEVEERIEQDKARQKAFEVERVRVQEEERRKSMQAQTQNEQQNAYYQDQLARKRQQDQMNAQRAMREHELKRQEESAMRIEQLKRQTAEYEANLKKQVEAARVVEETTGRIRQERENWDLRIEQKRLEAQEFRETVLLSVKEAARFVGDGVTNYLNDYEKIGTTVAGLSLLAVGVYAARNGTAVAARTIEARIGKPPLVRETSRRSAKDVVLHPLKSAGRLLGGRGGNPLDGVVLDPQVTKRLEHIAAATYNTKKNKAPFRHMLLHGPPGTGKTMWAKNLAHASGMDYAVLTGGDVAPLGRDGVTEIHKLFDWAGTSRKGLLMFVDEADAFLRKRSNEHMSEDLRNSLNAFLYRTGESSKNFMIVFASNQPEQLDWAVNDRTDEMVYFGLPDTSERIRMVKLYFDKMIVNPPAGGSMLSGGAQAITVKDISEEKLEEVAARIKGFSGREISKLAIAWQSAAYGSPDCTITPELLDEIVEARVQQHAQKLEWEGHGGQRSLKDQ